MSDQNDARHVIVKETPEGRVRLRGVFTDEQFAKLPLVKSFGAFPSGYHACHYAEAHTSISSQILALPESPIRAEVELGVLERAARRARYVVENGDNRAYFPSVKSAVDHVERMIVSPWLGMRGPRGGYSNRAPRRVRYGDRVNEPGVVISSWSLVRSGTGFSTVRIRRLDARGALQYAVQHNRREVA